MIKHENPWQLNKRTLDLSIKRPDIRKGPGRGYRSRRFRGSGSSSHAALRRKMMKITHACYRKARGPDSDQHAVWQEVALVAAQAPGHSPVQLLFA